MKDEKESVKIGLEIHGYLVTKEKLFCRCPTNYKVAVPNTNICPICTGQPGSKPMLPNAEALRKVIAISLMLGCRINSKVIWQRKHYDWPDLPKGYQDTISGAYSIPVAEKGEFLGIKISEAHLEEDPARWDPVTGKVDYNRCGMPLIEIVTEPEFKNSKEVHEWLNQLLLMLDYIKAVDSDAGIKADINVSIAVEGKRGDRIEIKNLNSMAAIEKAINYEILRQTDLMKKGGKVKKETRAFNELENVTIVMRAKEEAEDYRFIPDPDLPIVEISNKETEEIKSTLPELPHLKVKRLMKEYNLSKYTAGVLSSDLEIANFFEKIAEKVKDVNLVSRWVTIELLRVLNWNKKKLSEVRIKLEHFVELLELIEKGKLTELGAKRILNEFIPRSFFPSAQIKKVEKIEDKAEIEKLCKEVIAKNKSAVEDYKKGEQKALNFLIGQVVVLSGRRADSQIAKEVMLKLLR